ncbi:hypothetical protein F2P81_002928 [Scophthalmus maximus]|uniref:Uncharacterized protein n=1 Tax=Scophthalmus maximus TaxID=52904 RepID=A0A6A4TJ89_SCOMX|nr:hypothetical protein F2P81_002928 [Scophthalmus maximus]
MFRQSAHCSPSPRDPDRSSCSSDTGDVLIRSTRILLLDPDCRPGAGPGPVQITVQEQRPQPGQNPDTGAPPRAATDDQPASNSRDKSRQEVVRPTAWREVRVRLLDSGPLQTGYLGAPGPGSSFQHAAGVEGVQMEAGLSFGCLGDATYATAAAIAAAAPLIKSQLLESALKIVTGHAPATSTASDLTTSDQPARLQVTDLDTAAHALGNQQPSSSATRAAAALATSPVSIATPSRDRPEQTR